MKYILHIVFLISLLNSPLNAQVNRPEQDCINPLNVCSEFVNLNYPYEGFGEQFDYFTGNCSIDDKRSAWLRLEITRSGMLGFNIIPVSETNDWDFMLFNMNDGNCDSLYDNPGRIVSCNARASTFPTPVTGMNNGTWPQDEPMMYVDSGDVYYLLVRFFSSQIIGGTDTVWSPVLVDFSIGTCGICSYGNDKLISGKVFEDSNNNCQVDTSESLLRSIKVMLQPVDTTRPILYSFTNEAGIYKIIAPDTGQYKLRVFNPTTTEISCRTNDEFIQITDEGNFSDLDFAVISTENCADIYVRNTTSELVRCFRSNRIIEICNQGNLPAEDLQLRLIYDPVLIPVSFPLEMILETENSYQLSLPQIPPFSCIRYQITDSVSCSSVNVWEACVDALIEPKTRCSSELNGTFQLVMESSCSDGYQLRVTNTSVANMSGFLNLKVYGDFQMLHSIPIKLDAGEVYSWNISDAGWNDYSSVISEEFDILLTSNIHDCNLPQDDASYWRSLSHSFSPYSDSLSCEKILASYDPNDKTGYPLGVGPERYILREQKLKYKIRFQNTGSGMAYNVIIRDTLPGFLDEGTIRVGASSHAFNFQSTGKYLTFVFPEIFLPDSSSDPSGSSGFVEFYIDQKRNNPSSYVILNRASIYFDYNDPVITEPSIHRVEPISLNISSVENENLMIYPNPSDAGFFLENCPENSVVTLLSSDGKFIKQVFLKKGMPFIATHDLQNGFILIRIDRHGDASIFRKLVIHH